MLLYMVICWLRRHADRHGCVDTIARYLFYAFIIDFSLEMLDLIHRIYEADESFQTPRLHGADAAVHLADRPADRRSARSCRSACWR